MFLDYHETSIRTYSIVCIAHLFLEDQERNKLYTLLKKYECLFYVNLGTWHGKLYDIKLKPDTEPYHGKPFPVPRIHELMFKQEPDRLNYLKVIKKFNRSQ